MQTKEKIHQIALSQIKGIGTELMQRLITQLGTAMNVFQCNYSDLCKVKGCHKAIANSILKQDTIATATQLLAQHEKAGISILTCCEETYPQRLKHTYHAPPLLYYQGNISLNHSRIISIVGTRKATSYGKKILEKLLPDLQPYQILVVSGLAYGIDIHAHHLSLQYNIATIAVMANHLGFVYPSTHTKTAVEITQKGGLISEHPLGTKLEKYHFAARNRIIAGMADLTVVIEAPSRSGALITAYHANEYDREIFAVTGDIYADNMQGCHHLIKTHQAHLLTDAKDIITMMQWNRPG